MKMTLLSGRPESPKFTLAGDRMKTDFTNPQAACQRIQCARLVPSRYSITVRRFAYAFLRFGSSSSSAAKAKAESNL